MTFFCGVCYGRFPDEQGMTANSSLDHHLVAAHNIDTHSLNGTATLEKNEVKEQPRDRSTGIIKGH